MSLSNRVIATYQTSDIESYKNNPLIEALPPLNDFLTDAKALKSKIHCSESERYLSSIKRVHHISRIIDEFFQPLNNHFLLHEKLSIMIRSGYVGRNPNTSDWAKHIQNGYERVIQGDLSAHKFTDVSSTAQSMTLIGCSGCGKTTTITQLLSLYPQVIYHPSMNMEQVVYLKIDCSHDGSLKEICQNFFRAMDRALKTSNYEKQYSKGRHGIETLLAGMAQVANAHALGVLIIDEIQHLSRSRSGGSEKMLNFFVTLVNTIGLPVILVGTPKARQIFEADMRSARRGSGFGALFWDPLKPSPQWDALTDKLWKLQWLQKSEKTLSDEIRDTWYDLSQGVLDIVIKLFVLSQLRAIALNKECITSELMRKVYADELKPVHPMLEALRSKDPLEIAKYSDLHLKDTDKRLLKLQQEIIDNAFETPEEVEFQKLRNKEEEKVYTALKDEFKSSLLVPVIKRIFDQNPTLTWIDILPIVNSNLKEPIESKKESNTETRKESIKLSEWHSLESDDFRYLFSQKKETISLYDDILDNGLIFDMNSWIEKVG